jgi:phosphoribosylaminoimidazole-succinocarboxamide synthase
MGDAILTSTSIGGLSKLAEGKVRALYSVDQEKLLFVASDRISAYDVVMANVQVLLKEICKCQFTVKAFPPRAPSSRFFLPTSLPNFLH